MKNKKFKLFITIFYLVSFDLQASEVFNFDVTEVEILENGNKFKGKKEELLHQIMVLL